MARAIWNDTVIAESDTYESVDGNVYFPADAIKSEYFQPSDHKTTCGWKGVASYYTVISPLYSQGLYYLSAFSLRLAIY